MNAVNLEMVQLRFNCFTSIMLLITVLASQLLPHACAMKQDQDDPCTIGRKKMVSSDGDQRKKYTYCEAGFFCDNPLGSSECQCARCPGPWTNCCRNTLTNCLDDPQNCTVASQNVTTHLHLPSTKPTTTTTTTKTAQVGRTTRTTNVGTTARTTTVVPSSRKTTAKAKTDSPNTAGPPRSTKAPVDADTTPPVISVGEIVVITILATYLTILIVIGFIELFK